MIASSCEKNSEREAAAGRREVPVGGVVNLLESLFTRRFCRTLLQEVNAWTRVDHCALMRITADADLQ